jgi:hypothetical protein
MAKTDRAREENLAGDLLKGARAIGEFINAPQQMVFHYHRIGAVPTFKLAGTICARKSQLNERLTAK